MALPSPLDQKNARDWLNRLFSDQKALWAVHYACQSLNDGASDPRIGAIALYNVGSGESVVFSVSALVQMNALAPEDVPLNSDLIERRLIEAFYAHAASHRDAQYLHWNMGSQQFGFAAFEHRLFALGGTPTDIRQRDRHDLAVLLMRIYGDDVARSKAKLGRLAELNGLKLSSFLSGAEEAQAMAEGQYRKVAVSCEAKARVIADLARRAHLDTLKTEASLVARRGGPLRLLVTRVYENPLVMGIATIVGLLIAAVKFGGFLFGAS